MIDVASIGETLWDLRTEDLESLDRLRAFPGGAAANVALSLVSLGVSAELWAPLGDDPMGRALSRRLRSAGVRLPRAKRALARTGLVVAGRDAVVSYRLPRDEARALTEVLPARLQARVVHLAALWPDTAGAALARAVAGAAASALLTVDLNARPRLWRGRPSRAIWPAVAAAHLVKCSRDDLKTLQLTEAQVRRRMRREAVLVITDGARPSRVVGPFGILRIAPRVRANPRAMGAGDRMVASLLAALISARSELPDDQRFWLRAVRRAHAFAIDSRARP